MTVKCSDGLVVGEAAGSVPALVVSSKNIPQEALEEALVPTGGGQVDESKVQDRAVVTANARHELGDAIHHTAVHTSEDDREGNLCCVRRRTVDEHV